MQTGTIAKIMDKGFGFISVEGQDKDLFFHMNEINADFDSLQQGQAVSFDIVDGPKGPAAVNVNLA